MANVRLPAATTPFILLIAATLLLVSAEYGDLTEIDPNVDHGYLTEIQNGNLTEIQNTCDVYELPYLNILGRKSGPQPLNQPKSNPPVKKSDFGIDSRYWVEVAGEKVNFIPCSNKTGIPKEFEPGFSQVIKAFHEGRLGRCVGDKARLTAPAYWRQEEGGIPRAAMLIIETELFLATEEDQSTIASVSTE